VIRVISVAIALLAIVLGLSLQDDPYRLHTNGLPGDQLPLAHRDSPYSHITWVTSTSGNYAQLRFFDKVEGGVCLSPGWDDLADLGVSHLAQPNDADLSPRPAASEWPKDLPRPNPGTLSNTRYICLYPTAILLNQRLMNAANNDPTAAKADILIVGLGSGIGAALYAHHFPQASITVVDIDAAVIDMVRDHYPLLRWLENQTTDDGRPRLKLVPYDARQFVRFADLRDDATYDVVVLDAYTSGSTIPPHLMTHEFYGEIAAVLNDDGIVLSNIIGSYLGAKRQVLGGAMRSMITAGLEHVHNFPIYYYNFGQRSADFDVNEQREARNNVVLASRSALDPKANPSGWQHLEDFVPYPELHKGRYQSLHACLIHDNQVVSTQASLLAADGSPIDERLLHAVRKRYGPAPRDGRNLVINKDANLVRQVIDAVRTTAATAGTASPRGWDQERSQLAITWVDWVEHARGNFRTSVELATVKAGPRRYMHSGSNLVGDDNAIIADAPLFTDAQPNADMLNN
jgi:spermidine synthase